MFHPCLILLAIFCSVVMCVARTWGDVGEETCRMLDLERE